MTLRPICHRCGRGSCPAVASRGRFECPRAEIEELTEEWYDLLADPDKGRLASALAELSFNVRCLQRAQR